MSATFSIDDQEIKPSRTRRAGGITEFAFPLTARTSAGEAEADVEVSARSGDFTQEVWFDLTIPSRLSARIQTDKPIYQPTQAIRFRAIVQDAEGRAAPGRTLRLRVENQDSERVHTADLTSSPHGIVKDEWQIPASAVLGTYHFTLSELDDEDYQVASHVVRVSRYELPTFQILVQPDRTAYLPGQPVDVTVNVAYLFGKPVPNAEVKLYRADSLDWSRPEPDPDLDENEPIAAGAAAADGAFKTRLDLAGDFPETARYPGERYRDLAFIATARDPLSGRIEQRRFAIRLSSQSIHVYLRAASRVGSFPTAVYIATAYPDGSPAITTVKLDLNGSTQTIRTNRYGLAKALVALDDTSTREIVATATGPNGESATQTEWLYPGADESYHIQSSRILHRAGQSVSLRITTPPEAAAREVVVVHAIAGGLRLASRIIRLQDHQATIEFPYQKEFRGEVVFAVWGTADPDAGYQYSANGATAVLFPDASDLKLTLSPDRASYRPSDRASLRIQVNSVDGKPQPAVLGLAVVDQAVLERARTETEFGARRWFACAFCSSELYNEVGGISLAQLLALSPKAPITPELELAAEILLGHPNAFFQGDVSERFYDSPKFPLIWEQYTRIQKALSQHFLRTLEFPRDLASLHRVLGAIWTETEDPWMRPYRADFSVAGADYILSLASAGPDKQFGTADDFIANTFRSPYFFSTSRLMETILHAAGDYPATAVEFEALLARNGLRLPDLRDPWDSPYRSSVTTQRRHRVIVVSSAGPDSTHGTGDDVNVAVYRGEYFRTPAAAIQAALARVSPSKSSAAFHAALAAAGLDPLPYRDAWGNPYRIFSVQSAQYTDRLDFTTVRQFSQEQSSRPPVARTTVTPVTQHVINHIVFSDGPDGVQGTSDDFELLRIPVLLGEESATQELPQPAVRDSGFPPGTGGIAGQVTDITGGLIPGASVVLLKDGTPVRETNTGESGAFFFVALPEGRYALQVFAAGFKRHVENDIPIADGRAVHVDIVLQLGAVSETVQVSDQVAVLNTESAQVASAALMSTPRVRDYFPETLRWLPELVTDSRGRAQTQFTMADSVTTWKVAAIASTPDGRIAEAELDLRAFQPFFLDFTPPHTLTAGDEIELSTIVRNYSERNEEIALSFAPSAWASPLSSSSSQISVEPGQSASVGHRIRASLPVASARQRIEAKSRSGGDAIEKTLRVRPDGQEVSRSYPDLLLGSTKFEVEIPRAAISAATSAELRVYPNMALLLLDSAASLLTIPRGCAEQTISSGFASLTALRFAKANRLANADAEMGALRNVQLAVASLPAFEVSAGGLAYWKNASANLAVTALGVQFLAEARAVTPIDNELLLRLVRHLEKQQKPDGSWADPKSMLSSPRQPLLLTASVVRALSVASKSGVSVGENTLSSGLHVLSQAAGSVDEPYMLANLLLTAIDLGNLSLASRTAGHLAGLSRQHRNGRFWDLPTNSPFYGWGSAGRYETTGLVVSALARWHAQAPDPSGLGALVRAGSTFLVRGRGHLGYWYSTQATLQTMRALADVYALSPAPASTPSGPSPTTRELLVRVNGRPVQSVPLPPESALADPIHLDLSSHLSPGANTIHVEAPGGSDSALVTLAVTHWLPWDSTQPRTSPELRFAVSYSRVQATPGEAIRCSVNATRVGHRGYGMMLAELPIPPATEVDRASLEMALDDSGSFFNHYEVQPDRVVFYLWPQAEGSHFEFTLVPRVPMNIQTAPARLYDYNNPDLQTELPPVRMRIEAETPPVNPGNGSGAP
jgi:hypothetical protein